MKKQLMLLDKYGREHDVPYEVKCMLSTPEIRKEALMYQELMRSNHRIKIDDKIPGQISFYNKLRKQEYSFDIVDWVMHHFQTVTLVRRLVDEDLTLIVNET